MRESALTTGTGGYTPAVTGRDFARQILICVHAIFDAKSQSRALDIKEIELTCSRRANQFARRM
ncbi:MAG TPA: hypothetical protein VHA37_00495, partial [Candidatus Saccharimonadales bacterium]|nr:hypothetical protein [Candidatus Saccharimonadales bacterium]